MPIFTFLAELTITVWRFALALRDLAILRYAKPRATVPGRFGFLIHDRDGTDVYRWFPALRYLPASWQDRLRWHLWPVRTTRITSSLTNPDGAPVEGWLIAIILTAEQMVKDRNSLRQTRAKINSLFDLADRLGIGIVGLGAYSASVTRLGTTIGKRKGAQPTTGHAFTAWAVYQNLLHAASLIGITVKDSTIAFVGAGSIGTAVAGLVANRAAKVVIVDKSSGAAEKLADQIRELGQDNVVVGSALDDIKCADFVVVATTSPETIIKSHHLKQGAVVVDDSQPRNVSPEDAKEAGAIVVDGGVTYHPGIDSHFDFGMYDSHDLFGCLVEATLLAMMNGKCPPVIDRPSPETIRLLANAAEQVEIEWRTRSFDQPLPADDITRAKAARAATT